MSKVLLIGWDAADWKIINPLIEAGEMPSLKSVVENGVIGRLATLDPPLSPMLWTSIATGKRPYKHGIHGFTEPIPGGLGIRPIYNTGRKCKAVWNILSQAQKRCHVVGWWPSHPAEPINGTMISNFFAQCGPSSSADWRLAEGAVHPAEKSGFFRKLRVHADEITAAHVAPFLNNIEFLDERNDPRIRDIVTAIAATASYNCAATYLMEHEEWDFLSVYFSAIDQLSHRFMKYNPPRREHIPLQDFEIYSDVVRSVYRFHDMMLGRYLELIDDQTTLMIVSDHGFHPGLKRPARLPKEPTGAAIEHSPYGIIAMSGPGIKRDELIFGASLLDITPTLLNIFDLPAALDMDGKVLSTAFENPPQIEPIESWELVDGNDGRHRGNVEVSAETAKAELRQLIDLGYIDDPGEDAEHAVRAALEENSYHLARAYFNGQFWAEGISILEELHLKNPNILRFATYLANGYIMVGRFGKARHMVDHIRRLLDRENAQIDLLEGTILLAEERPHKALELFAKVESEAGEHPQLTLRLANTYFQLHKFERAIKLADNLLATDEEEVGAWYLCGICYYHLGEYDNAVEHLLRAIGLQYFQPVAHFYLAETLLAQKKFEESATAFEVVLRLAPAMNAARKRLVSLYENFLQQPEKADLVRGDIGSNHRGEVVVVSGLPRSGTSMMMQMLAAGGMNLFIDDERPADESNKKGYFEHAAVKNLAVDASWMMHATGKAVKVIAQLIPSLPLNYKYKIILMERDIAEIVSSQEKMLIRLGRPVQREFSRPQLERQFGETFDKVCEWISQQYNVELIRMHYSEVLADPQLAANKIDTFLGGGLDTSAMAAEVDARMRREVAEIGD